MTVRKPRANRDTSTATTRVPTDTSRVIPWLAGRGPGPFTRPAMLAATGASSRPITATTAPMAAGGKMMSSQRVPAWRTMRETKMKNRAEHDEPALGRR